jgi:hypothetical protein
VWRSVLKKRISRAVKFSLVGSSLKEISKHPNFFGTLRGLPRTKIKKAKGHVFLTIGIIRFLEITCRIL